MPAGRIVAKTDARGGAHAEVERVDQTPPRLDRSEDEHTAEEGEHDQRQHHIQVLLHLLK
jgi:hypothetical protein